MPQDRVTNRVELDVGAGRQPAAAPPAPDTPFCIAVLGDFSGRGARGSMEVGRALVNRKPVLVDRDNFDEVLARFAPRLEIPLGSEDGARLSLRFASLDDFHPDRLYDRLPIFDAVRDTRERLADPAAFARVSPAKPRAPEPPRERSGPPSRIPGSLLDEMLGDVGGGEEEPEGRGAPRRTARDDLQSFIDRAVEPHLVPSADPGQKELIEQLDAAASAGMRAILHHPDFQALEALWRSVLMLVRRVDDDARVRIHLVDVAEAELVADLAADGDVERTGLYGLLVESTVGTPGAQPWSLLVGGYTFGRGPQSMHTLRRLARLARAAGAPWIAGADPRLAGCPAIDRFPDPEDWARESDPEWEALRRSADAQWLGLALPRLLLRLPYGEDAEPAEVFPLEEMGPASAHEDYLWGNPAVACALLLAESFAESGWAMRPGARLDIGGLPLHVTRADGETMAKPCAEALLTERAALRLMDSGLMALVSMKESDAVRLVRFQSVAHPIASLAGRWRHAADADRG